MSYFNDAEPQGYGLPAAIVPAFIAASIAAYPFWRIYAMMQKLFRTERGGVVIMLAALIPFIVLAWYFKGSIGQ